MVLCPHHQIRLNSRAWKLARYFIDVSHGLSVGQQQAYACEGAEALISGTLREI